MYYDCRRAVVMLIEGTLNCDRRIYLCNLNREYIHE